MSTQLIFFNLFWIILTIFISYFLRGNSTSIMIRKGYINASKLSLAGLQVAINILNIKGNITDSKLSLVGLQVAINIST